MLRMSPEILDRPKKSEKCNRECSHADCVTRINITQTFSCFPLRFPFPSCSVHSVLYSSHQFLRDNLRDFLSISSRLDARASNGPSRPSESLLTRINSRRPMLSSLAYHRRKLLPFCSAHENHLANSREWYTRTVWNVWNRNAECDRVARLESLQVENREEERVSRVHAWSRTFLSRLRAVRDSRAVCVARLHAITHKCGRNRSSKLCGQDSEENKILLHDGKFIFSNIYKFYSRNGTWSYLYFHITSINGVTYTNSYF